MQILTFNQNPMGQNCYAVLKGQQALIIDPGFYTAELAEFLAQHGPVVEYVLLTHGHFDHFLALPRVLALCPNAKVVLHEADLAALTDPMISLAAVFQQPQPNMQANIVLKNEQQTLPFAGEAIRFMHTPGHTPGSVCFFLENSIFSGDTLFHRGFGRTDHVGGSLNTLRVSIKRLLSQEQDFTVYPGHGRSTTILFEKNNNPLILV